MRSPKAILLFIILSIFATLILSFLLSSCKVTKGKLTIDNKKTEVSESDSGKVSINTGSSKNENEWWREYLMFQKPKDTTNNYFYTNNTTQPAIIIREGGKQSQQSEFKNYDSSWKASFDSLSNIVKSMNKTKETQVLSFGQIIGLAIGASILIAVLITILSKLKIGFK